MTEVAWYQWDSNHGLRLIRMQLGQSGRWSGRKLQSRQSCRRGRWKTFGMSVQMRTAGQVSAFTAHGPITCWKYRAGTRQNLMASQNWQRVVNGHVGGDRPWHRWALSLCRQRGADPLRPSKGLVADTVACNECTVHTLTTLTLTNDTALLRPARLSTQKRREVPCILGNQ